MTSGLETEWDYSGRKGRDGQKKKIGKANESKEKVKRGKDEEVNGQGGKRGAPAPHGAIITEAFTKRLHENVYDLQRPRNASTATTQTQSWQHRPVWQIDNTALQPRDATLRVSGYIQPDPAASQIG